jgi:pilus assembly protein Flp/PilA
MMYSPRRFDETGASAVEYGLLLAGIAAVITAAVLLFGGSSDGLFRSGCASVVEVGLHGDCPG